MMSDDEYDDRGPTLARISYEGARKQAERAQKTFQAFLDHPMRTGIPLQASGSTRFSVDGVTVDSIVGCSTSPWTEPPVAPGGGDGVLVPMDELKEAVAETVNELDFRNPMGIVNRIAARKVTSWEDK